MAQNPMQSKVPYTEKVELFCWDVRRSAQAAELGIDSMVLEVGEPLIEGSLVTLRLKLSDGVAFTVLGRVGPAATGGAAPGRVAVDFIDISPSDRARIAAFASPRRAA
jgi:hypothetical protein